MCGGDLVELIDRDGALSLDAELVRIARSQSAVRLAMGEGFVALAKGYQELGFSTFEGYANERCVRGARWAQETRALAARLAKLPRIRAELARGAIGWCMAEALARAASPEDEEELLEATRGMTVRQVVSTLRERGGKKESGDDDVEEVRYGTLELSASFEDAWALEATRPMAELLAGRQPGAWMEAVLAEAHDWLTLVAPGADPLPEDVLERQSAWLASVAEGARRADRREERAESSLPPMPEPSLAPMDPIPSDPFGIDRVLFRELAPRLASCDARFGQLLARFFGARAWRVLGFATEKQYARERLGMSRSAVRARITLARRLARLEKLGDAWRDDLEVELARERGVPLPEEPEPSPPTPMERMLREAEAQRQEELVRRVRAMREAARRADAGTPSVDAGPIDAGVP